MPFSTRVTPLIAAVALCTACGVAPMTGSPAASSTPMVSGTQAASGPQRVPLPSGFPVLAGAAPVVLAEDDPGLMAAWTSDQLGSAAYDFYVMALPAAGYPIVGLYPGGEVALIRFRAPNGATWQMVAHGGAVTGTATIEIRLDRP